MRILLPLTLALAVLGYVTAAPADDPEVPEKYITVDEAKALADNTRVAFVDVRPPEQYEDLHIHGALNLPLADLALHLAKVPKDVPIVLY